MTWTDTPPTRRDIGKFYWFQIIPVRAYVPDDIREGHEPEIGRVAYEPPFLGMWSTRLAFQRIMDPSHCTRMIFAGPIEQPTGGLR